MKKISMRNSTNLKLDEAHKRFIKNCVIKNLSPQTIKTYRNNYNAFEYFLGADAEIKNINSEVTGELIPITYLQQEIVYHLF